MSRIGQSIEWCKYTEGRTLRWDDISREDRHGTIVTTGPSRTCCHCGPSVLAFGPVGLNGEYHPLPLAAVHVTL